MGPDPGNEVVGWPGRLRRIGAEHLQRHRAARGEEPFATAIGVPPAFEMHPARVGAGEHVGFEIGVGGGGAMAFQMRLPAGGEFGFIAAGVAVGAFKD